MVENEAFKKSIDNATVEIVKELLVNMELACLILETETKKDCPVDQGITRASITHSVDLATSHIVGTIGCSLLSSIYVHQGTGLYASDGNGRKTPWKYKAPAGKYKGWHTTKGQKPNPFMDRAKIASKSRIERKLGGK